MRQLIEILVSELERPREVSPQVVTHLIGTYGISREAVGPFLANELAKLEDYEVDLVLSPLFTPTLRDQAVFGESLGRNSIPPEKWPELVRQILTRPTHGQFVTEDGRMHSVLLQEVTVQRFVHRLRLEAEIPESLFKLICHLPPAADRPLLKAVARRAVWENAGRRDILIHYLTSSLAGFPQHLDDGPLGPREGGTPDADTYRLDDVLDLLKLVETYQPASETDLLEQIPHWQQVLTQEINEAANPKLFFNERVQEMHGGGRDQRRHDNNRVTARENEKAFLDRLRSVLTVGSAR
jgi:hypothetical protein